MSTGETMSGIGTEKQLVISKYARRYASGSWVTCRPSNGELSAGVNRAGSWGTDYKVIYDSTQIAEACARELEALGAPKLRAYECGRSRSGHAHLTQAKHFRARGVR